MVPVFLVAGLLLTGCSKPAEKEAAYIKRGNQYLDQGEYEKARVEYKNAARIMPTDPEVAWRLGLVSDAQGDYRAAFDQFSRAVQQNPHFHPALLKIAEYYLAAEQYEQVQKRIGVVLTDDPNDPGAHALHAALLLRDKDYPGTEKEARFALEKDPANVTAFSVLTGLYEAQGNEKKALATIDDGIARNPRNLPLLILKSNIYEHSNDLDKTAESYEAIFKVAPKETHYRVDLANIYLKAGQLDKAEAILRAGVVERPDDWDMKHEFITFLGDHRGVDAAEKEIRGYMQANPDNADLDTWLVDLYISHNAADRAENFLNNTVSGHQFDKQGINARTALARLDYVKGDKITAGKLAEDVLDNDPNNLDARFLKARLEFDNGFYQNAVIDLRGIVRDRPKAVQALQLLGEAFLIQGHPDLAIDTLNRAIEADPLDFAAKVRLAQMYHLNGDTKRAMDLLFLVTKTEPQYSMGWEATARIALDTKKWDTAETAIKVLDGLQGQHPMATFLRGMLLSKTDHPEEAIAQYKQVIEGDPSSLLAERALMALVQTYRSQNRMDEATQYIESLKIKSADVSAILGESYLDSGKTEQAAASLDSAISTNSSRPEPYLDRARMFLSNHAPDKALDTLKKGIAAAPSDLRATLMEAQILGDMGHYQEAIALYDDMLAHNPDMDPVANNLAEIIADYDYNDSVALEKARHVAERFTTTSNPLFLDTLAWVYFRQDKIEEARTTMERAIATGSKLPPQVHYHYGAILIKAGKVAEAKAELKSATAKDANYPGIDEARKLLAQP